jgi:Rrf2 family protein
MAVSELVAAYGDGPVTIKTIAQRQGISTAYLEQLLARLRKGGIVRGLRGCHGGYELAAPPQQISLADVLSALEGPVALTGCVDSSTVRACSLSQRCATRPFWEDLGRRIGRLLAETTLDGLVRPDADRIDAGSSGK